MVVSMGTPSSRRDIPLHGDFSGMLPRLRHVVGELHAQEMVHVRAERHDTQKFDEPVGRRAGDLHASPRNNKSRETENPAA